MKQYSGLILFVATAIFYLLFNSHIPVTDPVESNYALTAKEMLLSGDWFSPRIYGQFWYDKPAMIYWLILISYKIFGINEFAARFPSVLCSAFSVSVVYWFAYKLYKNRRIALVSAIVLATSLEFWILAKMVITDAVLFLFTGISMAAFYLGLLDRGRIWYVIAYITAALAVLTKGPVGIVLPGFTIVCYIVITRRWELFSKLFLLPGLAIFLIVAAPWYFYMYQLHGSDFINTFLGLHNVLRATVSEHPKDNVFYYYFVLFPLSILPWTGIFFRMIATAVKERNAVHSKYLLIWPMIIISFYTAMATKYPTYVFPAMFPVAILLGRQLDAMLLAGARKQWLWLTVPALLLLMIFGIAVRNLGPAFDGQVVYAALLVGAMSLIWAQCKGSGYQIMKAVTVVVIAIVLLLNSQVFPFYANMRSAKALVQAVPVQETAIAAYGDYPTSGVFYSGYLIPKVVKDIEKPDSQDIWAVKYTMPIESMDSFLQQTKNNQEPYIIVDESYLQEFEAIEIAKEFTPVATHANSILFKRVK